MISRREEMDELETDELSLLRRLDRVKAPPDFEQRVMARLSLARREARRRPGLGLSLAGAFASLLAVFVALNLFVLHHREPAAVMKAEGRVEEAAGRPVIPVIETFDYGAEVRGQAPDSGTVYLLEQVSDTTPKAITY